MAASGRVSARTATSPRPHTAPLARLGERIRRTAAWLAGPRGLLIGSLTATVSGASLGLAMVYAPDPSAIRQLERYQPSIHSVIYDDAQLSFDEWAIQRREMVAYKDIPPHLVQAVLATEDSRFFSHVGVDPIAVIRAVISNIRYGWGEEGASTLTMQLSRDLWQLGTRKTASRKLVEAFYYALQTERYYSKERIFELFATQTFMGHNVYGFAAAADYYFGKEMRDLTLAEAALLAGMIQRPNPFNPYRFPEAALRKRAIVLNRMVVERLITAEVAEEAKAEPLRLAEDEAEKVGAYFIEEIRKELYRNYGTEIYESGIQVYTTLDQRIQAASERALKDGLRRVDQRLGWRGDQRNLITEAIDPITYVDPRWERPAEVGDRVPAVVGRVELESAELRIADRPVTLSPDGFAWTRRERLNDLLSEGDLPLVRILEIGEDGNYVVELDQDPQLEGAVIVIENHTGEVKALVGGEEFDSSEFNRAIQAVRQTGSAFKPFVYAAAIRAGKTPSNLLLDQPTTFLDSSTRQPYEPSNYHEEYIGITSLSEALARSRNVFTVALQEQIGADKVIDNARELGITADLQPYLSLALGVIDVSLLEMTRAYAVFPNGGVRVEPHLVRRVTDREGRTLRKTERQAVTVMDQNVAYIIMRMLVNVVEYQAGSTGGTARRAKPLARELGMRLGGKTGTTDNFSDAWFIGFSPYHTIGVWVGNDTRVPIGPGEEGARVALPIWMEVMRAASEGLAPREFEQPAGIVVRTIDPRTGLLASEICEASIEAAYLRGTEPSGACTLAQHQILALPYYQQAYFLDRFQSATRRQMR